MKISVISKFKLWIIVLLSVICLGMVFLGIFGINNTVDFTNGYELTVGVDQYDSTALETVKSVTENYFEDKNISPLSYSVQEKNNGSYIVYKFNKDVKLNDGELTTKLEDAIDNEFLSPSAEYNYFVSHNNKQTLSVVLALAISSVVILLYVLIMEKFAVALSTFIVAVSSSVTYICLISIFRIPALSYLGIFTVFAFILSAVLSLIMSSRFKEIMRIVNNSKMALSDVVQKGANDSIFRFAFVLCLMLVASILLIAIGTAYLKFLGCHILVTAISSIYCSFFGTPMCYNLLKKTK